MAADDYVLKKTGVYLPQWQKRAMAKIKEDQELQPSAQMRLALTEWLQRRGVRPPRKE